MWTTGGLIRALKMSKVDDTLCRQHRCYFVTCAKSLDVACGGDEPPQKVLRNNRTNEGLARLKTKTTKMLTA